MPQDQSSGKRPRQLSANEKIRRRIQTWEDEDPSSLLTKHIEKATSTLSWLVSLMLPDRVVHEVLEKTLRAAEVLTDRGDVFKAYNVGSLEEIRLTKIDHCDQIADQVQFWATGAAAALGAWDVAGPLGTAPALASLFTISFRTIKKVGLCFGYDTSRPGEELIALHIFVAASTLYHRDKVQALKAVQKLEAELAEGVSPTPEDVTALVAKLAHAVTQNLQKRRTFAAIPAMGALVGSSTNAWLLNDVGWAARNIYADRRFRKRHDERVEAQEKRAQAAKAAAGTGEPETTPQPPTGTVPKAA